MSKARIFISYSNRETGARWKDALLHCLQVFKEHGLIDVWQDGEIRVGSFWDDSIERAMASAQAAVLLLTKEALETKYIIEREFPFLRNRQQRDKLLVIPVICEPCDLKAHEWLHTTQAPNKAKPLCELSEAGQDRVFRKLAVDIANELGRSAISGLSNPECPVTADRVFLDEFPLIHKQGLHQDKLIGREQELALLDLAFAQPHTTVVSLVAWGGVGKTMLAKHWLQRIQRGNWSGARRVYAWSFYSQGTKEDRPASEDYFLDHALAWFRVECQPKVASWEKGRLLAEAVRRECALLILDGIEPLQNPPGPAGGQLHALGIQSLLRELARRADDSEHHGLCLVTTREPIVDIANFQRRLDAAWGSVLHVDLGNLTAEAGAALLHHAGANRAGGAELEAEHHELVGASREVDNHALTLNLLGRFLDLAHEGDIRKRKEINFEEADRRVQGGTTFRMLKAFENWFAESGALYGALYGAILRMLGLFDRPADHGTIADLRKPPAICGLTEPFFQLRIGPSPVQSLGEKDWNTALAYLADFGLVVRQDDPDSGTYEVDCHPLIREYFSKRLQVQAPQAWTTANGRIAGHLLSKVSQDIPDAANSASRRDIELLFNAASHECAAGKYSHVLNELYRRRISQGDVGYATRTYGLFSSEAALLASFFDPNRRWDPNSCRVNSEAERLLIFRCAGFCLATLGRFDEGLPLLRSALDSANRMDDSYTAAVTARNLANFLIRIGELSESKEVLERNLDHASKTSDKFMPVGFRCSLAYTRLLQEGPVAPVADGFADAFEWNLRRGREVAPLELPNFHYFSFLIARGDADTVLSKLDEIETSPSAEKLTGFGFALFAMLRIIASSVVENWDGADALLDSRQSTVWQAGRSDVISLWHLTRAEVALHRLGLRPGDQQLLDRARVSIEEGIEIADRDRMILLQTDFLRLRAWLRSLQGEPGGSREDLNQAWNNAERRRMQLNLADILLLRSRLFFRETAYPWESPQADLAAAEKLINECNYHRRQRDLADVRKIILGR